MRTPTAEAVHAEIRRAVIGVWHWISPEHLDRYLDEISWRHNRRDVGHLRASRQCYYRLADRCRPALSLAMPSGHHKIW